MAPTTTDMLATLVGFDTTSRQSNLIVCGSCGIARPHQPDEWIAENELPA